ncbi:hypothetical protein G5I_07034 [Acromyrmex echinatior]|uniref:Uncharacterized protein n=1 Tax=Acromyrmex echinatior TaxID=103372 RepID=F4WMQ0_ACREC|nr:hypothetical protein G5I_07034 [Acromyrmex echinatior]
MLKGWDGGERWLEEKAPHGRVFDRTREAVKAIAMRPQRDVESEHHLVNSRVLFPSASAPIGLRDHETGADVAGPDKTLAATCIFFEQATAQTRLEGIAGGDKTRE